jgi:hypothetical protein
VFNFIKRSNGRLYDICLYTNNPFETTAYFGHPLIIREKKEGFFSSPVLLPNKITGNSM